MHYHIIIGYSRGDRIPGGGGSVLVPNIKVKSHPLVKFMYIHNVVFDTTNKSVNIMYALSIFFLGVE